MSVAHIEQLVRQNGKGHKHGTGSCWFYNCLIGTFPNFTVKYPTMLTTGQSCNSFFLIFSTWNLSSQQRKSQRYWFKTCKLRKCVFTEGIDLEKWEVLISLFVKCFVSTRSISILPGNLRHFFQNSVQTIKHKQVIQCTCPVNFELPQKRQSDLVNNMYLTLVFLQRKINYRFFLRWYLSFTQKVFKLLHLYFKIWTGLQKECICDNNSLYPRTTKPDTSQKNCRT